MYSGSSLHQRISGQGTVLQYPLTSHTNCYFGFFACIRFEQRRHMSAKHYPRHGVHRLFVMCTFSTTSGIWLRLAETTMNRRTLVGRLLVDQWSRRTEGRMPAGCITCVRVVIVTATADVMSILTFASEAALSGNGTAWLPVTCTTTGDLKIEGRMKYLTLTPKQCHTYKASLFKNTRSKPGMEDAR